MLPHVKMNFSSMYMNFVLCISVIFDVDFINFPLWKTSFIFCLCFYTLCWRGNNQFDVHFWRIGPVSFTSKDGNDAVHGGRTGRRGVYFPPESALSLHIYMIKVLFCGLYLDLTCKQFYFQQRKRYK